MDQKTSKIILDLSQIGTSWTERLYWEDKRRSWKTASSSHRSIFLRRIKARSSGFWIVEVECSTIWVLRMAQSRLCWTTKQPCSKKNSPPVQIQISSKYTYRMTRPNRVKQRFSWWDRAVHHPRISRAARPNKILSRKRPRGCKSRIKAVFKLRILVKSTGCLLARRKTSLKWSDTCNSMSWAVALRILDGWRRRWCRRQSRFRCKALHLRPTFQQHSIAWKGWTSWNRA